MNPKPYWSIEGEEEGELGPKVGAGVSKSITTRDRMDNIPDDSVEFEPTVCEAFIFDFCVVCDSLRGV